MFLTAKVAFGARFCERKSMDETFGKTPSLWRVISEREVADCRVFKVSGRTERNEKTGIEYEFFVINAFNWVVALAKGGDGRYLLVNQFRFGSGALSWEFPAGCVDSGEAPVEAAARELAEETGYAPVGQGRVIGRILPNPALQDNVCWIVLFEKVEKRGEPRWQDFEEMEIARKSLDEIIDMAKRGEISHGMAHAALFFLQNAGCNSI
jgi:ADP-ribose pyrophosphatase